MNPNGTRVVVVDGLGGEIDVTEGVQALYDIVVQSMDWGSGFLSVEEALPVVAIAKECGYTSWEAAEAYIGKRRHVEEFQAWIARQTEAGVQVYGPSGVWAPVRHEHEWSSVGRCLWPKCEATL